MSRDPQRRPAAAMRGLDSTPAGRRYTPLMSRLAPILVLTLTLAPLAALRAENVPMGDVSDLSPDAVRVPESISRLASEDVQLPDRQEIEDALPEGASLNGREIWERFFENRMHAAVQYMRVISADPGGGEQLIEFWVRWKDFRDEDNNANEDGILAKGLIKFKRPGDMRGTGFLMIMNEGRGPDQFVYRPSTRRIRRVKLRDVGIMGTDYTLDDLAYRDIEEADYHRLPDDEIDGIPVYVVEATLKPFVKAQYRTTTSYLEKEHFVPLRAVYKDESGVPLREAIASYDSIRNFDGIWIPTESELVNLKEKTTTKVIVDDLDANPDIGEHLFSTFRLGLQR